MDRIEIDGLTVECIIGVRPHERHRPQRVVVDVSLGVEVAGAGRSGRLADTCDYDIVAQQISAVLLFRRYELMETAAEELSAMLFAAHPLVQAASLRICKPAALQDRARGAAVRLERERAAYPPSAESLSGATVRQWLETHEARLHTVTIPPECTFDPPGRWRESRHEVWLSAGSARYRERSLVSGTDLVSFAGLGPITAEAEGAELFVCLAAHGET